MTHLSTFVTIWIYFGIDFKNSINWIFFFIKPRWMDHVNSNSTVVETNSNYSTTVSPSLFKRSIFKRWNFGELGFQKLILKFFSKVKTPRSCCVALSLLFVRSQNRIGWPESNCLSFSLNDQKITIQSLPVDKRTRTVLPFGVVTIAGDHSIVVTGFWDFKK